MKNQRIYANGPKPKFLVLTNNGLKNEEIKRALEGAKKEEKGGIRLYLHQNRILTAPEHPNIVIFRGSETDLEVQLRIAHNGKIIIMGQIPRIVEIGEKQRTEYTDRFASMEMKDQTSLDEIFQRLSRIREVDRKLRQWELEIPIIGMMPREGWDQKTQKRLDARAKERNQLQTELNAELADMLI